jgi:hypothetical protein
MSALQFRENLKHEDIGVDDAQTETINNIMLNEILKSSHQFPSIMTFAL